MTNRLSPDNLTARSAAFARALAQAPPLSLSSSPLFTAGSPRLAFPRPIEAPAERSYRRNRPRITHAVERPTAPALHLPHAPEPRSPPSTTRLRTGQAASGFVHSQTQERAIEKTA